MGTHWISPNEFAGFLGDRIGYKSGFALTREEIIQQMERNDPLIRVMSEYSDQLVPLRTDHIEDTFQIVLFRLGAISQPFVGHPLTVLNFEYQNDEKRRRMLSDVLCELEEFHFSSGHQTLGADFDENEFFRRVVDNYSQESVEIAKRLVDLTRESEEASPWPWINFRKVDWKDEVELQSLFSSESLATPHGQFFDQRFIDYLERNDQKLSDIHWRKFEGLVAEYFSRSGFKVEIGPGRGDGGIDIRVWNPGEKDRSPPVTLVQCKRQQHKIDKVIVKSLWADVVDENAQSGLIVTTSSLSPGADKVRKARSYPINCANRDNVKSWLKDLRTPGRGTFLGS